MTDTTTINPETFQRAPERDICRTLVGPHKQQADRLRELVREIGTILDSEGGKPVALIIGGYENGVHLISEADAEMHLLFFYKDEVILLEKPHDH